MTRYSRNIATIGAERQQRLSASSVIVIGCGALGGQIAMLLAGAGVGTIGIMDFDTVDISNLQRQLFFSEADAGLPKTECLAARMSGLNSEIEVKVYPCFLREEGAEEILKDYDFVIDATDNHASKMMIERVSRRLGIPCCTGGVSGWRGQVTTIVGDSAGLSAIFPDAATDHKISTPCGIEGVIGATASHIASVQASEAIKYLSGAGNVLENMMYICDLSANIHQTINIAY